MNLGFWNFYSFYNANRMFEGATAPGIGDDQADGTYKLGLRLRQEGHNVGTLDMMNVPLDAAVFFDHPTFLNPYFRKLRKSRTKLYLFILENPIHRPDNYWKWLHRDFERIFVWNPRMVDNRKYFQFYHPMKIPTNFKVDLEQKKKFCVTIFSQKYSTSKHAIYDKRMEVIRWFEKQHPDEFDLYGQRWDRYYFSNFLWRFNIFLARLYAKFPNRFVCHRFPSYRGPVQRKRDVMRQYKFAVTYENAIYPGYVTEKIFDAYFAGCIPIYLGAPDVTDFLPADTLIDARNYPTHEALYDALRNMSEKEYLRRIRAIEEFVNGRQIQNFGADKFVEIIMENVVKPHLANPA